MISIVRKTRSILLCAASVLMLISAMPVRAMAVQQPASAAITVVKELRGSTPSKKTEFTFELTPVRRGNPMPEEGKTVSIRGAGTAKFGKIMFSEVGDYSYLVREKDEGEKGYTYDDTVYRVTIRVINDENGGLGAVLWATEDGDDKKVDEILFVNRYSKPTKPDKPDKPNPPPETPDKPNTPPDTPDIPDEEVPKEPFEPGTPPSPEIPDEEVPHAPFEDGGDQPGPRTPSVPDRSTPRGPSLPQTGMMWWLVPILLIGGLAMLIGSGFAEPRSKNEE